MSYAIRAWRDATGSTGIIIGTVFPVGYDNHVAEVSLTAEELPAFMDECAAAARRGAEATGRMDEPMPGAYEKWDHE